MKGNDKIKNMKGKDIKIRNKKGKIKWCFKNKGLESV